MINRDYEKLEFSYESTAAASYLVVKTGLRSDVLDYQVSMTSVNKIGSMASFDMKCNNGYAYFYYNITSLLSLSLFLKRKKLMRNEFIRLLADITKLLIDCEGYLLSGSNFILNVDYLYINPETLDISMIYIPVDAKGDVSFLFREFIIGLILKHAEIDESNQDNFLQKILGAVRNDLFNMIEFLRLLDSLLFSVDTLNEENHDISSKIENLELDALCAGSVKTESKQDIGIKAKQIVGILLLQLIIISAAFFFVNFSKYKGHDSAVNYAAFGLIAAALDVIVLKNILRGKGISIGKINRQNAIETKENMEYSNNMFSTASEINRPKDVLSENTGGYSCLNKDNRTGFENNTVLLGKKENGFPVLKSRSEKVSESIEIHKSDFLIGRLAGQVDFICKSNAVGKVHAQIISSGGVYVIKDLNSINGTFINNVRIPSNVEHELRDGDNVAFANCEYIFYL
jgi:FOG: FHA domain